MALYEHIFLARQDISPAQVDQLVETAKTILEQHGGKVSKVENWGLRTLSYRIEKNRKAHYSLMNIEAPAIAISELERQWRISEDVLRYMTIRVEKHEQGPSAILSRKDKEERFGKEEDRTRRPRRAREENSHNDEGAE